MLEIAVGNTDRLVRLINDILDIERIESGKVSMVKQTCDAANLCSRQMRCGLWLIRQELLYQFLPYQPGCGSTQTGLFKPSLTCSATRLNFQARGLQFGDCRVGNSRVSSRDRGEWGRPSSTPTPYSLLPTPLKVPGQGSGRGIPADKIETIFERFQQVDASDSRKGGTGLGLAICRSIVQHHGGQIWVESTLGRAALFFTLPASGRNQLNC